MNCCKRIVSFLNVAFLAFFASCFFVHAVPAQAALKQELPSLHYVFAHQYLPHSIYAEPQLGLALAFSEKKQDLLLNIWDHCMKGAPELEKNNDPTGLSVKGGKISDDTAIAIITMPTPHESPEAYYVCVVTTFSDEGNGTLRAKDIAYYTLEKSIGDILPSDLKTEDEQGCVPTIIGSWDKDSTHHNYGRGPAADSPDNFISAVLKLRAEENQ